MAALIVLGAATANAPAQETNTLTEYDCQWKWEHDSQIGWSCSYERIYAIAQSNQCVFMGVSCWDFVSDRVRHINEYGNNSISLSLHEIGQAKNCGGLLTRGGDCSVHEPTEEEKQANAFRELCEWTYKHDSQVGWSCTYDSLRVNAHTQQCVFDGISCWDNSSAANVENPGVWTTTTDGIKEARNCSGRLTPGGDCSVHEETLAGIPQPVDQEAVLEEKRHQVLAQCRSAWDESLECCRTDAMSASEDGTACHVQEPIFCSIDDGCDFEIPNSPGKAQWTPAEIRTAGNCAGTLRLDGNC